MIKKLMLSVSAAALCASTGLAHADAMDDLVAAAKKEGTLTTIALPHDWCGYGAVIDGFKAKYGLTVNELNPDAGSGDEIEAIKANKGNTGPAGAGRHRRRPVVRPDRQGRRPDPALQGVDLGLDPGLAKDADGSWYGDYYGVLAFEVNTDIVKKVPAGLGRPARRRLQELGRSRR